MPAYDDNPWSSLFFVIFIVVCMYIFVNIFLAVVYKNYHNHLEVGVLRYLLSALEVSFLYLALINRAGGLYGRILTEVVSTDQTQ